MAAVVIGAAGSFAAIATLLGSPLVGAFLLMEMAGLGGPMMEIVLVPGLLAAGVGSLIFVGLNSLTGFGSFSLTVSSIPHVGSPTGAEFLWAIVIGLGAAMAATGIFRLASMLRPLVARSRILLTPVVGPGGRRAGRRLCRGDRPEFVGGPVLGSDGACHRSSSRRRAGQWARCSCCSCARDWPTRSRLSAFRGRPDLSEHVHRRSRRHRSCPIVGGLPMIAGVAMGVGCDGGRGAEDAHDGRASPEPALPLRCRDAHARRHRGGGRVVRGRRSGSQPSAGGRTFGGVADSTPAPATTG